MAVEIVSDIEKSNKLISNQLHYYAALICDSFEQIEKEWRNDFNHKKYILIDPRIKFIISLKNKWVRLFIEEFK